MLVLWDDPAEVALGLVFVTMLAAITLTDLERRIIPNKILLVATVAGVAIAAATDPGGLPERAIAAAAAGGLLFVAALAYPRGMGLGDVKLAAVMGLFLGRDVGPAILVALLGRLPRRAGDDRPPRGGGAQARDPVRPLPRPRRRRRACSPATSSSTGTWAPSVAAPGSPRNR